MTKIESHRHRPEYYQGCLLGGAAGDALGAPVEFMPLDQILRQFGPKGITAYAPVFGRVGAITDDTQMTLFTAEAMLRAVTRGHHKGICYPPSMAYYSYQRWLMTQGIDNERADKSGWLINVKGLYSQRAPGNSCLSALKSDQQGSTKEPINNSKGCGGVMRIAPVGLVPHILDIFDMGCETAAITHGHPTGYLAAGCLAQIIRGIIDGLDLVPAIEAAVDILATKKHHEECLVAINRASAAWRHHPPIFATVESLGQGWVAEEALAIGIYCALAAENDFEKGLILAVNHGGDSDSTGAIAGNILGALLGVSAIPAKLLDQLELRETITQIANDLYTGFEDTDEWGDRYPGY
ncbi:MAG: ADP-ribosylglycohydrolase family protein [Thermodesulfobacteriota bacterium]